MAERRGGKAGQGKTGEGRRVFDLDLDGWLGSGKPSKGARGATGRCIFVGQGGDMEAALATHAPGLPSWLGERIARRRGEVHLAPTEAGPIWFVQPIARPLDGVTPTHHGLLEASPYAAARDVVASVTNALVDYGLGSLSVHFANADRDERRGVAVGLELGVYRYRSVRQPASVREPRPALSYEDLDTEDASYATAVAGATNLARHLVNVPGGELDPRTYAEAIEALFSGAKHSEVEVWDTKRLAKERMGLLLAVGQGAVEGPRLVRIRYRPKGKGRLKQPIAFVGKGITFDSGGLDMKDANSMRLMKKDMGGSASVVGLAHWAERSGIDLALDFYVALAENAVDQKSFRPGDILTARNGQTVEIDNTDAEGRLVLADALDVAVGASGADRPGWVINLATLTGAMRVGLGTRLAGLFANDDALAAAMLEGGQRRGDPFWRMPLYAEYAGQLRSVVADVANSGPGRFGGAITAALFLQRFVGKARWAHLDMYGWSEAQGALLETGGNGQCVQALADMLSRFDG